VSIINPGPQTGTVGTAASLQIRASDSDHRPLRYSASGLPAGLAIDPASGRISGTPTRTGTTTVSLTATDASGPSAHASFTWNIGAPATDDGRVLGGLELQSYCALSGADAEHDAATRSPGAAYT
jgi:hypothetical protein